MTTMRAWQYTTASGGLENNLFMPAGGAPKPKITDDQILVEVYSASINPADHKVPEIGMLTRPARLATSIPCMDFSGKVAEVGSKVDGITAGEMVFGAKFRNGGHGSLAQFVAVTRDTLTQIPDGLDADDVAGIGIAGLTAYQSIQPHVQEGDKVFINGGSGGTGVWGIQIAKALGCHVTVTCSGANVGFCKSLGADEVIDYRTADVISVLKKKGQIFSLIVDNVGPQPVDIYAESEHYLLPNGSYEQVGAELTCASIASILKYNLLPGFLGGGKRKYNTFMTHPDPEALAQIGRWMKEGKLKAINDSIFEFEQAPQAFEKLKTHRAKGKIVIHVREK